MRRHFLRNSVPRWGGQGALDLLRRGGLGDGGSAALDPPYAARACLAWDFALIDESRDHPIGPMPLSLSCRIGRSIQSALAEIDASAGRVIDAVDTAGIAESTNVAFASKNDPETLQGPGADFGGQSTRQRCGWPVGNHCCRNRRGSRLEPTTLKARHRRTVTGVWRPN